MNTCKKCGSHELAVTRIQLVVRRYENTIACDCLDGDDDVAMERVWTEVVSLYRYGVLDDKHRIRKGEEPAEEILKEIDEEGVERNCEHCIESASQSEFEGKLLEETIDPAREEIFLNCMDCGREIEFGRSKPAGVRKIWPVEADDFDHRRLWPDPKYRAVWAERGWLREPHGKARPQAGTANPLP